MGFLEKMEYELLNESEGKESIDPKFVAKLMSHLEKKFPSFFGEFGQNLTTELSHYMLTGDKSKMKEIENVRKKIQKIIADAKTKFFNDVQNKVEKIQVTKKEEQIKSTEETEDEIDEE